MKLTALLRSTETREITAEGVTYTAARQAIEEQVPEGWAISAFRDVSDSK